MSNRDQASAGETILAIETSCDETAVAILRDSAILASEVASQIAMHAPFGGVVPEIASRNHMRLLKPVLERALATAKITLNSVDVFAATTGPGLATSLMIGTSLAKGLAVATGKPVLAINHLEGHLLSPFFGTAEGVRPSVGLIVSGGHTLLVDVEAVGKYRLLGQTQDDAAGEAFDKVGKLLGLPYPGGPHVNRHAQDGNPAAHALPRSMIDSGDLSFSFSGLKTSMRYLLPKLDTLHLPDLCASFQEAVVDVLVAKTMQAAAATGRDVVAISGGVSCNTRLREKMDEACKAHGIELLVADLALCTDNAAMIAQVAALKFRIGQSSPLTEDIDPNLRLVA